MISQSIKSAIGANKGADSSVANNHITYNKGFGDDDLEMVDYASKSDKSVVDDSSLADLIGKSKKETAADFVDKVSRYLFPLLFIAFNVAYWVFFTIFVWDWLTEDRFWNWKSIHKNNLPRELFEVESA